MALFVAAPNHLSHRLGRRAALRSLAGGTLSLLLPACAASPARAARAAWPSAGETEAETWLDEAARRLLTHAPESATSLGEDTGALSFLRARLEDRSPAGKQALAQTLRDDLATARALSLRELPTQTRTNLAVVETAYGTALEGLALPYGDVAVGGWRNAPYVVIQNVGAYLDTPRFLDADHPVKSVTDAEAYISRLGQMSAQLDGELERMRAAAAIGVHPPDFLLDRAIEQMQATLADAGQGGGGLVTSLTGRTSQMPGDWGGRARAVVADAIVPALERQLAELGRQRAMATGAPGMRERPGGEEWYAWALRAGTTTRVPAEEIHAQGQAQLAELQARMDPILQSLGYRGGTVGARMAALGSDPRFMFADGDEGRAQILGFIQKRIDWIRARMPRAFVRLVPARVEVRRLPAAEEPGAPTAYGGAGSKDGTIPGRMWINLRTPALHRKYDLPTLVHHESIPGHVWQGEYANQLPLMRSILAFNAYSEGWALYGEQLADELGAYDDDPVGRLGYLQSIAFRACRMVVDTGLHAKGWSREQAVRFFMENNGNKREEVVNEVDRYCAWPGQACGYKMGHNQINRQRDRARAALGAAFDLREFDQAVVDGGNVPLDVLADGISRYMEQRTR